MLNLIKYHIQTPRYTSYPTAPQWEELSSSCYADELRQLNDEAISLYIHIPFCKSMCLFCGCSVILNRNTENEETYVRYLCKEIALVSSHFLKRKRVTQLHFGGGTPTKLSKDQLSLIVTTLQQHFDIDSQCEMAIEVDPRTVFADSGEKLTHLKKLGFNRVSFGVQDTNPKVQEAVKRHQSYEMTKVTFDLARSLKFDGINVDLIYGLPYQTESTFKQTVSEILDMKPDRIALFSYAKVPWLKEHQKAIAEETLPTTEEKFAIYENARNCFIKAGYISIGMDHFALAHDELAISYQTKNLQRNFQGYTVKRSNCLLGFGVTSIGATSKLYVQNHKTLPHYYAAIDANFLACAKGKQLSEEDHLRRWVIHSLMCHFELDKQLFFSHFHKEFDSYFSSVYPKLVELEEEGLIKNTSDKLIATSLGELFIRNIVMHFDAYLVTSKPLYSSSI